MVSIDASKLRELSQQPCNKGTLVDAMGVLLEGLLTLRK